MPEPEPERMGIVATGGRVLGVTSLGDTVEKAIRKSYAAVAKIDWKDVYYRKDIGQKAVSRLTRKPLVGIVMGSDSDLAVMEETMAALRQFGVPFEITVASAHRSPARAAAYAATAPGARLEGHHRGSRPCGASCRKHCRPYNLAGHRRSHQCIGIAGA